MRQHPPQKNMCSLQVAQSLSSFTTHAQLPIPPRALTNLQLPTSDPFSPNPYLPSPNLQPLSNRPQPLLTPSRHPVPHLSSPIPLRFGLQNSISIPSSTANLNVRSLSAHLDTCTSANLYKVQTAHLDTCIRAHMHTYSSLVSTHPRCPRKQWC